MATPGTRSSSYLRSEDCELNKQWLHLMYTQRIFPQSHWQTDFPPSVKKLLKGSYNNHNDFFFDKCLKLPEISRNNVRVEMSVNVDICK